MTAYENGYRDYYIFKYMADNPYVAGSKSHSDWLIGWRRARDEDCYLYREQFLNHQNLR